MATKSNHLEIVEIVSKFSQNFDRCNAEGMTPRMFSQENEAMSKIFENFEEKVSITVLLTSEADHLMRIFWNKSNTND